MTSTNSAKQPSGRVVTAIYTSAVAAAAALVALATLHAVYWPLPIAVAATVAADVDKALRASGHQIDPNHIAIVGLAAIAGGFVTSTVILANKSSGATKLHVRVLSPPSSDIEVPEKLEGVSGTVSDLPPGDTIWVMVQQQAISEWGERNWAHENDLSYTGPLGETATMVQVHRAG